MSRYDWDHAGAIAGSLVLLALGLLILVDGAPSERAALGGMGLVLLAWVLLVWGTAWRPR